MWCCTDSYIHTSKQTTNNNNNNKHQQHQQRHYEKLFNRINEKCYKSHEWEHFYFTFVWILTYIESRSQQLLRISNIPPIQLAWDLLIVVFYLISLPLCLIIILFNANGNRLSLWATVKPVVFIFECNFNRGAMISNEKDIINCWWNFSDNSIVRMWLKCGRDRKDLSKLL